MFRNGNRLNIDSIIRSLLKWMEVHIRCWYEQPKLCAVPGQCSCVTSHLHSWSHWHSTLWYPDIPARCQHSQSKLHNHSYNRS